MTNKMHTVLYTGVTSDIISRFGSIKTKYTLKVLRHGTIAINWCIIIFIHTLRKPLQLKKQFRPVTGKTR
jgi:predicted GIY-YIG superfamily endonuclease